MPTIDPVVSACLDKAGSIRQDFIAGVDMNVVYARHGGFQDPETSELVKLFQLTDYSAVAVGIEQAVRAWWEGVDLICGQRLGTDQPPQQAPATRRQEPTPLPPEEPPTELPDDYEFLQTNPVVVLDAVRDHVGRSDIPACAEYHDSEVCLLGLDYDNGEAVAVLSWGLHPDIVFRLEESSGSWTVVEEVELAELGPDEPDPPWVQHALEVLKNI